MDGTKRFDQAAGTWDEDPARVALARTVADQVVERLGPMPSAEVLDFGCGTGLLTLALRPHVGRVLGADSSAGMLGVLERKVRASGVEAVRTCLLDASHPLSATGTFDLIVSSMTLHHVRDLPELLRTFRLLLKPGGRVALADLDREDGTFHKPEVTDVFHLGFDRAELAALLSDAGFGDCEATTAFVHRRNGREYPVFLLTARGR